MRILLDMDGPLADFDQACWDLAEQIGLASDIPSADHQSHRFMTDHIAHSERWIIRQRIESTPWFRKLPVVEGSQEGVQRMLDAGWDVWACTKPLEANATCRDDKAAWMAEHFPMLDLQRLILASDKSMVRGDVLLDDAIKPSWVPRADWVPVTFRRPFNGPGTPHHFGYDWSWEDPLSALEDALLAQNPNRVFMRQAAETMTA